MLTDASPCPQCSVTCGKGYRQRLVSCSEIYTGKDHYEYGYQNTVSCPGTQPPNIQPCYLGECPVSASWRVSNWGSVSLANQIFFFNQKNFNQPLFLCYVFLRFGRGVVLESCVNECIECHWCCVGSSALCWALSYGGVMTPMSATITIKIQLSSRFLGMLRALLIA